AALNRAMIGLYRRFGRGAVARRGKRTARIMEAVMWQADHFEEIPVLILACYHGRPAPFPFVATTSWFGSIYPAVQDLLLAALALALVARGLATGRSEPDPRSE